MVIQYEGSNGCSIQFTRNLSCWKQVDWGFSLSVFLFLFSYVQASLFKNSTKYMLYGGLWFITINWFAITYSDICGTLSCCSGEVEVESAIWLHWCLVMVPATSAAALFTEWISAAHKVQLVDKQSVMLPGQESDSWTLGVTLEI